MDRVQVALYVVIVIASFIIGVACGIEWGYVKKEEEYEKLEQEKNEEEKPNITFEKNWKL